MAKTLLARGARGELVRLTQLALIERGLDPKGVDGKFGKGTESAVKAFQQASSFDPTGAIDASIWTALVSAPVPSTLERALQLTAAFEGHGFTVAQGNWDGAGITWGIIGFTLKHGELGKIILKVFDENPAFVEQSFAGNTEELIEVLNSPKAVQMQFADSISLGTSKTALQEPWRSAFRAFGEIPEVQALQLLLVEQDYWQPSAVTAAKFGLTTELGRSLTFDIHVQNGGIKASARQAIEMALDEPAVTTEQELRVIIANAVADASATSSKEDVRSRKLAIATGTGQVHGETFVLNNWGLDESAAGA
jgi:peptidoglycan hydrolase-like protein with peptidoglycan-binding domain